MSVATVQRQSPISTPCTAMNRSYRDASRSGFLSILFRALIFVLVTSMLTACSDPDQSANRLAVEGRKLLDEASQEKDAPKRVELARRALENFDEIVEKYPESDLATKIIANESVAGLTRSQIVSAVADYEKADSIAKCAKAPDSHCVYGLTKRFASDLPKLSLIPLPKFAFLEEIKNKSDTAIGTFAIAEILMGDIENGQRDIGRLHQEYMVVAVYLEVAKSLRKIERLDEARKYLLAANRELDDLTGDFRTIMMGQFVRTAVELGEFGAALTQTRKIHGHLGKYVDSLTMIAEAQHDLGEEKAAQAIVAEAMEVTITAEEGYYRSSSLSRIVGAQVALHDFQRALETAQKIKYDSGGASERTAAFIAIADALTARGRLPEAKEILADLYLDLSSVDRKWGGGFLVRAFTVLGMAQVRIGAKSAGAKTFSFTRKIIGEVDSAYMKSSNLNELAIAMANIGNLEKAGDNWVRAIRSAKKIDDETLLGYIVSAQAEANFISEARTLANRIKDTEIRGAALRAIAKEEAERDLFAAARRTAFSISDSALRDRSLTHIALEQAGDGDFFNAVAILDELNEPESRLTLSGLLVVALLEYEMQFSTSPVN